MADILLDENGDIDLSGGRISIVRGDDAIKQKLSIRFKFFLGESPYDQRVGIPYFQDILKKDADLNAVRGIFRDTILSTPGIDGLETFELELNTTTRTLTLTFKARKDDGEVLDFSEAFIVSGI